MKKITSFLMALFVVLGAIAQEAEMETYDFKNWPAADVQLATSDKVGTAWETGNGKYQDVYQCTTEGLERFAFQGYTNVYSGKGYWLRVGTGLGCVNATRSMAIQNLGAGDLVTFYTGGSIDFKGGGSGDGTWSVEEIDGGYAVTMLSDGNLGCCFDKGTYVTSITIEFDAVDLSAPVAVTGVTLNKNVATVPESLAISLSATVEPVNATDKTVEWSSSDENVATVDNGVVTGLVPGKATITATASGFSATCEVTVTESAPKTSWDFTELQAKGASFAYAVNTINLGGAGCNYAIGEFEGLAVQGAGNWFLYNSTKGLYHNNSGGRNIAVLDLNAGQIVTVVVSTVNSSGVNNEDRLVLKDGGVLLSKATVDDKTTYIYVINEDGALVLNMARYFTIYSITSEEPGELAVEAGVPSYTRSIAAEAYGTICLPFAPDAASLENYSFFAMQGKGEGVLNFVEVTELVANTPYIYCLKEGKTATAITGTELVPATPEPVTVDDWNMVGSYAKQSIDATTGNYYGLSGGKIVKATKTLTVKPYRAYFTSTTGTSAVALRITRGDETTEITAADLDVQPATVIYDLAGRRVEKMEKGIYIVNGKKVIK